MVSANVAMAKNRVIGKHNDLPWYLPADLKRVKEITTGNTIIMGRKTADSIVDRIGHGLPNRKNIVVTRSGSYEHDGFVAVKSIEDALQLVEGEAFIFGGAQIYELSLPYLDRMYITEVQAEIDGDIYFPEFAMSEWTEVSREQHQKDEKNHYDYDFVELVRNK